MQLVGVPLQVVQLEEQGLQVVSLGRRKYPLEH